MNAAELSDALEATTKLFITVAFFAGLLWLCAERKATIVLAMSVFGVAVVGFILTILGGIWLPELLDIPTGKG